MWLSQDQVAIQETGHVETDCASLISDPEQLGLVRIELETISGHPLTDICDAAFETISCWRNVVTTAVQIHLCVVSERVYRSLHYASGLQLRGPPCIQWTAVDRAPSPVEQNIQCRPMYATQNVLPERYDRSHASTMPCSPKLNIPSCLNTADKSSYNVAVSAWLSGRYTDIAQNDRGTSWPMHTNARTSKHWHRAFFSEIWHCHEEYSAGRRSSGNRRCRRARPTH